MALTPSNSGANASAHIYQGEILEVDPSRWVCKVKARQANKVLNQVRIPSLYCNNAEGEGIHYMPEVGTWCWVCVPSDSEETAFIITGGSTIAASKTRDGKNGSFHMNRPYLNPGDVVLTTRDGNGISLRRGGVVELRSTPLSKIVMDPSNKKVICISENYVQQTFGGSSEWKSLRREKSSEGLMGTRFQVKAKEFADNPGHSVIFTAGNTGKPDIKIRGTDDSADSAEFVEEKVTLNLTPVTRKVGGQVIRGSLENSVDITTRKISKLNKSSRVVDLTIHRDEKEKDTSDKQKVSFNLGLDREGDLLLTSAGALQLQTEHWIHMSVAGGLPAVKDHSAKKVMVTTGALGNTEPVIKGETFLTELNEAMIEVKTILAMFGVETPKLTAFISSMTSSLGAGSPYLSNTLESE